MNAHDKRNIPDEGQPRDAAAAWADAALAAALFAVDPVGLGVMLRARAGPVRDRWTGQFRSLLPREAQVKRIPLGVTDDRLIGGLDLTASLAAHRPIACAGLLAEADGGVVILAMAERIDRNTAARIVAAHDDHAVALEREGFSRRTPSHFGVLALDEGAEPDEKPPEALADRLAFHIDLDDIGFGDAAAPAPYSCDEIGYARSALAAIAIDDSIRDSLCATAWALGISSLRAPLLAIRAAIAHAALTNGTEVRPIDAATAARLVLAARATILPSSPEEEQEPPPPPEEPPPPPDDDDTPQDENPDPDNLPSLDDLVLAAARAAIPRGLLARLMIERAGLSRGGEAGRSGAGKKSPLRGRPAGVRQGKPHSGAKLHVIETLRAAAPWQRLRQAEPSPGLKPGRLRIHAEDFRIRRHVERKQTTTIFVVDASGSSALNRLAEAKGAVELLLADCYVRRDRVALISFRNREADLILPPTRSLARAKRCLAAMPGGGGTPLATALDAACVLAQTIDQKGGASTIVVMTDGRANIARDGGPGRARANEDALAQARTIRAARLTCALIDTSPQPQPNARALAEEMGAYYLPLPHADATELSSAVRATAFRPRQKARAS